MKNAVLFTNERALNEAKRESEKAKQEGINLFNEFKLLNLPFQIKSVDQLLKLSQDPEKFIVDEIAKSGEVPKLFGIPIKAKAIYEMAEFPSLENLKLVSKQTRSFALHHENLILKNDNIQLSAEKLKALEDLFSFRANTPELENLHKAHQAAADSLINFQKALLEIGLYQLETENSIGQYFAINRGNSLDISPSSMFYMRAMSVLSK
jgi:hypothetical protein